MKIVAMGTGGFAVPTFRSLLESNHEVVALVTRPDKPVHRRKSTAAPNPMREAATVAGLPILEPESVNTADAVAELQKLNADLFFVCDYGQILSNDALTAARLGGINLHGSLLPKYRGAAPINWALYHGEKETGVTVIHMTPKLDGGPCLVTASLTVEPEHDAVSVESLLSDLGVRATHQAIEMLSQWNEESIIGSLQDKSQVTKAPRLKKSDGRIDWTRNAVDIFNQVRAFRPWPGTFTSWQRNPKTEVRLLIDRVDIVQGTGGDPGAILLADKEQILVACGKDVLSIRTIQPAGKKLMTVDEFIRGYQLKAGDRFST